MADLFKGLNMKKTILSVFMIFLFGCINSQAAAKSPDITGDGKVDFPAIFQALDSVGFSGPFALELEATPGQDANRADCLRSVERSISYLRRIGVLPPE